MRNMNYMTDFLLTSKPFCLASACFLWREILVDLGYPDVAVIDDIISGFSLTGWAPRTGVFRPDVRRIFQLADNTFSLACQTVLAIC